MEPSGVVKKKGWILLTGPLKPASCVIIRHTMEMMSLVRQKIHTTLRREASSGPLSFSSSCHSLSSLLQLTSEDSCLDKDHTSSMNNSPFLYALRAKGVSQEKVMQEKSPALSTGCWCLEVVRMGFSAFRPWWYLPLWCSSSSILSWECTEVSSGSPSARAAASKASWHSIWCLACWNFDPSCSSCCTESALSLTLLYPGLGMMYSFPMSMSFIFCKRQGLQLCLHLGSLRPPTAPTAAFPLSGRPAKQHPL